MRKLLGLSLLLLGLSFTAGAADFVAPKLTGPVVDELGLIEPGAESRLESQLRALSDSGHAQVVVLVASSLQGLEIEDYGIRLAEAWKIGFKGGEKGKDANRDRGVLFIVAPKERKMRIEVGYGLEGEIPDVVANRILESVVKPHFRADEYSEGIVAGATVIMKIANGDGTQAFPGPQKRSSRGSPLGLSWEAILLFVFLLSRAPKAVGIPASGVLGFIFGFLKGSLIFGIIGLVAGALITGVLGVLNLGSGGGRGGFGGGGFGGGGFGGGSFGGGGGGFSGGGGSFGGGGSSSSW